MVILDQEMQQILNRSHGAEEKDKGETEEIQEHLRKFKRVKEQEISKGKTGKLEKKHEKWGKFQRSREQGEKF